MSFKRGDLVKGDDIGRPFGWVIELRNDMYYWVPEEMVELEFGAHGICLDDRVFQWDGSDYDSDPPENWLAQDATAGYANSIQVFLIDGFIVAHDYVHLTHA